MMTSLLRGQPVESKRLSAELIERKSTAPPKSAASPPTKQDLNGHTSCNGSNCRPRIGALLVLSQLSSTPA